MESGKGANVDDEQELGLKILTLHAEQESNVMAVKTFNVPVDFPFDVGDAVLMGITTDHFEYKQGSEPVNVKIDYFGEGTAQIELYLDEEKMDERSVTLNGVGSTGISLNSSSVSGGFHSIKAVLTKDGLTSVKTTGFIYGPNLPDLVVAF